MASGNDCPSCGENIGIGAVFKASLPNRIWCPHCGTRLQYGGTWLLLIVVCVLTTVLLVGAFWVSMELTPDDPLVAGSITLGVFIAGGAVLEVAFVLELWYGKYALEPIEKPKPFDADDEF